MNQPTQCYQCSNNAMYLAGPDQNIPLCLECYSKVALIQQQQVENHERMLNYLSDQMAHTVGLPPMGPRFPARPRPAIITGATLHNISVNNSVIGTINTGNIGSIDQSITALGQLGAPELGKAFKEFSEAIINSRTLNDDQKNELVEILSVVSKEAATPPQSRKKTVIASLLDRAKTITGMASDVTNVAARLLPYIAAALGLSAG